MENKDFLKNIYEDFFGTEKIEKENEKLRNELNLNEEDCPEIEVEQSSTLNVDINKILDEIDDLYITEESKDILKKVIEYTKKYSNQEAKQYIPFNMCIYSDNKETIYKIIDIISDVTTYFSYIKKGYTVEASLYNIEKVEQIEDIYKSENSIIVLKDLEGFVAQDQIFKDKFLHRIEEKNDENTKQFLTIIVAKNKEIVSQAFDKNEDIREKLFNFEIVSTKPEIQDVYQDILNKLQENGEVSEDISVELLDYISVTYPKTTLSFPEYRDKLCEKILFNKKIPEYEKEKSMEEIFEELNNLVGLTKVKQVLQDLVSLIELKDKTKNDLKIKNTNLHMVFLGNPGTGKTTVARIVAQILYNLKYIKQNKLVEASSKDLVAEYVGQTAPKTMAVIEKAMGGVLFIDEAYSLASGSGQGNSYNEEAIATLIQAMENYRDDLVVIFAGYSKEMQDFLNMNSGIVSRIGYTLEFEDYSEEELLQIFQSMMKKSGFEVTNEAFDEVLLVIKKYKNTENFGNARFVRNLYEKTIIKHASNTKGKKTKKILKTITKEDISTENLLLIDK